MTSTDLHISAADQPDVPPTSSVGGEPCRDDGVGRSVAQDHSHGPFHVRLQCRTQLVVDWQAGVITGADETADKADTEITVGLRARMELQHE